MSAIEKLTEINWESVIIAIFAILFAIKEIFEACSSLKKTFRIKTGADEDKENLEERISKLEKHDNWQYTEINKISQGINDIKSRMDKQEEAEKQRIITQYGADLYNMHDKFMKQEYVTKAGLETFRHMADDYLTAGGNHSIKDKIIPEVYALEIRGGAYGFDEE
jgi:uncharacterized coiled-coil protein SlyX